MAVMRLDPARSVIEKIGIDKVADITGKHVSNVYRWMYPREQGGTGGLIPQGEALKLLAWARDNGIALSPADFFAPEYTTDAKAPSAA